jgi:hypothetical protein
MSNEVELHNTILNKTKPLEWSKMILGDAWLETGGILASLLILSRASWTEAGGGVLVVLTALLYASLRGSVEYLHSCFATIFGVTRDAATFLLLSLRVYLFWDLQPAAHVALIVLFVAAGAVSVIEISIRLHLLHMAHLALHLSRGGVKRLWFLVGVGDWIERQLQRVSVNLLLVSIEVLLVTRHASELRRPKDPNFWKTYQLLLVGLNGVNMRIVRMGDATVEAREKEWAQYLDEVSGAFRKSFGARGILDVAISIMELREEKLVMTFENVSEGSDGTVARDKFDRNWHPRLGEGAAGRAFQQNAIAYIPSKANRHGVVAREQARTSAYRYEMRPKLYSPSNPEPFQAILSVPIRDVSSQAVAVLSFSSNVKNAFSPADFKVAWRAALLVGLVMNPEGTVQHRTML